MFRSIDYDHLSSMLRHPSFKGECNVARTYHLSLGPAQVLASLYAPCSPSLIDCQVDGASPMAEVIAEAGMPRTGIVVSGSPVVHAACEGAGREASTGEECRMQSA